MKGIARKYRKYWILGVWVLILGYLVFSFGIVGNDRNSTVCTGFEVEFESDPGKSLIHKKDIEAILADHNIKLKGETLRNINIAEIEQAVAKNHFVKEVAVYKTIQGEVRISIQERLPLLRVVNRNGQHFYLDHEGQPMPTSKYFAPHVLLAGGYIPNMKFKEPNDTIELELPQIVEDLYKLASFVSEDEFWNAQITQVYVNEKKEFQLWPRVGGHKIEFGSIDRYERKFAKLDALYRQGFGERGWAKYRAIDLKYKDQVVCRIKDEFL